MKAVSLTLSLRARLLLATTFVLIVMLSLLMVNGIGVMDRKLAERTRIHLEEQKDLLNAALAVPLAKRDYQGLQEVLASVRHDNSIVYMVLFDRNGEIVATSGWDRAKPLPPVESVIPKRGDRFDTKVEIWGVERKAGHPAFRDRNLIHEDRPRRADPGQPVDRRHRAHAVADFDDGAGLLADAQPDAAYQRQREPCRGRLQCAAAGRGRRTRWANWPTPSMR